VCLSRAAAGIGRRAAGNGAAACWLGLPAARPPRPGSGSPALRTTAWRRLGLGSTREAVSCERHLAARGKGNQALNLKRFVKIYPYFVKIIIAIYEINDKFVTM
jgi:hypothetical protein